MLLLVILVILLAEALQFAVAVDAAAIRFGFPQVTAATGAGADADCC